MISSTSLAAFSGAIPSTGRSGAAGPVQPVRAQPPEAPARQATPVLPEARPSLPPPRGSLLNLSV